MQRARAMMLRNEIRDLLWQTDLLRQAASIRHVAGNDLCALMRAQAIVWVLALLVLNEVFGCCQLTNIVIEGSDAGQQRICSYSTTSVFCQLTNRV